jgi:disulfide bond formation protein DsbB
MKRILLFAGAAIAVTGLLANNTPFTVLGLFLVFYGKLLDIEATLAVRRQLDNRGDSTFGS